MKSTGIVRKVDPLGRITLAKETRDILGITEGTPVEIFTEGEYIILKKYKSGCNFCGEVEDDMFVFGGQPICRECRGKIREGYHHGKG